MELIENITVQVPTTTSINKDISLKKWSFNLFLKSLSEFVNFRSVGKLSQTIGVRCDNFFWPEQKGYFSFKTEDLVGGWFWPDFLYISWKHRGQVFLKSVKAIEQRYWLNLSQTGSQLIFSNSFIPVSLLYLAGGSI